MTSIPRYSKYARYFAILAASVLSIMLFDWVRMDLPESLETDWTAFDRAADRLLAGEEVYRPFSFESEPLPYFYPPFALWLALPLGALGFWGSYIYSAALTLIAYIAGLRWFGRSAPGEIDRTTGIILAVASGATIGSTLIGQYSGVWVLSLGGACLLFTRDRKFLAGLALALLWLKPNIAIAVPVVLVWSRSWQPLKGFALGSGALGLASLPLGLSQWSGFISNARNIAELQEQGLVPLDKMVTVLAGIQTTFGIEDQATLSLIIWLPIAAVTGVSVLTLWSKGRLAEDPVRAFGALALFVVAANPRLYFYDATLAAFGMFGLWMSVQASGSESAKRRITILALIVWFGLWGSIWLSFNLIVGPAVAVSLVATAISSRQKATSENVITGQFGDQKAAKSGDFAA